jgi:apolipoprotein N-acyltransferase
MNDMLKKVYTLRRQVLLALLSGLLLVLAFPKIDLGWVAYVALIPLLAAIRQSDAKCGFWLGYTCGMAQHLGLIYWTAYTMKFYGHLPMALSLVVLLLFCAYLSIYTGLFGAAVAFFRPSPYLLLILGPLAWVLLEMAKTWLFTGFPWALLGYSLYDHLWVIQIADLFGVYGISGLVVMVNVMLTLVVLHWLDQDCFGYSINRRTLKIGGAAVLAVFLSTLLYGVIRMHVVDGRVASAPRKTAAVVQGNIDQAQKWDPRFQMLTTVKYRKLSLDMAAGKADLIIWPETATPFYFLEDPILTEMVMEGIRQSGAHFIIGSPSYASGKEQMIFHNSAYLITPKGRPAGKYDKVHLVPFGEYVPLKRWLPFIKKMVAQVGDFKPGKKGSTLAWDRHQVGLLICYEIIFPGLSRSMVNNGAHLLVNITNDAWFGRTSAAYQHFSMAVLRAIENRRMVARAANTGISGFIDPCGRITHATGLFKEAVLAAPVALLQTKTRYTRWGDWPLGLAAFGLLATAWAHRFAVRRKQPGSGNGTYPEDML